MDPRESHMYWLKRTFIGARRVLDEVLAEHQLTASQGEIIRYVLQQEGISQRELQERLHITSATLTGLVNGLVKRGMLRQATSPQDARVKQLYTTERSQAIAKTAREKTQQMEQQLLKGFTSGERALLLEFWRRMFENLEAQE